LSKRLIVFFPHEILATFELSVWVYSGAIMRIIVLVCYVINFSYSCSFQWRWIHRVQQVQISLTNRALLANTELEVRFIKCSNNIDECQDI